MTVILTDTSQLDSFCLLKEKHRLIYIHGYFGSAPKIEGFKRFLLLSSTIHFSALENNRDFWSFFVFPHDFSRSPGNLWSSRCHKRSRSSRTSGQGQNGAGMVMAWCFRDHQPWICFCGLFGPLYQGKSSLSTSELLSEGTVLILFKCEDFISIILIQYSWWFMMWYHQDSGSSRGTFSWQNHSPIWHKQQGQNFQISKSIDLLLRPSVRVELGCFIPRVEVFIQPS